MPKQTYISLLRGINVGGHRKIPMAELRALYSSLGFDHVQTYIQSGNVVFLTTKSSEAAIVNLLESAILHRFGFDVSVIIRTARELKTIVANNPFVNHRDAHDKSLHVVFLPKKPTTSQAKALNDLDRGADDFALIDREIYLLLKNGVSGTKLLPSVFEKLLDMPATARNWRTANILLEMSR